MVGRPVVPRSDRRARKSSPETVDLQGEGEFTSVANLRSHDTRDDQVVVDDTVDCAATGLPVPCVPMTHTGAESHLARTQNSSRYNQGTSEVPTQEPSTPLRAPWAPCERR